MVSRAEYSLKVLSHRYRNCCNEIHNSTNSDPIKMVIVYMQFVVCCRY